MRNGDMIQVENDGGPYSGMIGQVVVAGISTAAVVLWDCGHSIKDRTFISVAISIERLHLLNYYQKNKNCLLNSIFQPNTCVNVNPKIHYVMSYPDGLDMLAEKSWKITKSCPLSDSTDCPLLLTMTNEFDKQLIMCSDGVYPCNFPIGIPIKFKTQNSFKEWIRLNYGLSRSEEIDTLRSIAFNHAMRICSYEENYFIVRVNGFEFAINKQFIEPCCPPFGLERWELVFGNL